MSMLRVTAVTSLPVFQEPAGKVVDKYRLRPLLLLLLSLPLAIGCFCADRDNPNRLPCVIQDRRTGHARCGQADRQPGAPHVRKLMQAYLDPITVQRECPTVPGQPRAKCAARAPRRPRHHRLWL